MPDDWDILKIRFYAEEGNAAAQRELAIRYAEGREVPQDDVRAVKWFRLAAKRGDAESQYRLAVCYEKGVGVEPDSARARKWYRRAASKGHTGAAAAIRAPYRAIGVWIGFLLAVIGGGIGYEILGGILGAVLAFILVGLLAYCLLKT